MEKKKPTVLPGLVNVDTKPKVLTGIKKAADNFKGSALPIMKYFGNVKPSRNEKIIKPDMTPGGKVINQDLPTIREALKPGFSSNFTTNYTPPSLFDASAVAYFTATGITDATEKDAVNQLVIDLKGIGSTPNSTDLWTDASAFYPISPTSLSAAAYNLRDTSSFNITWANSPAHAATGVTFNGSTQYGDTGFNPSTETLANGYDITLGTQIVNASATAVGLMSAVVSSSSRTGMLLISGNIYQDIHNTGAGRLTTSTSGTYEGRMIVSADRIANGGKANYLNGSSLGTKVAESSGNPVNLSLWVGAQNNGSGGQNFTAIEMRFGLIIPKGLNATEIADLDDAIVRYSTALSRNV